MDQISNTHQKQSPRGALKNTFLKNFKYFQENTIKSFFDKKNVALGQEHYLKSFCQRCSPVNLAKILSECQENVREQLLAFIQSSGGVNLSYSEKNLLFERVKP